MDDVVWGNLAGTWDALHTTVDGIGLTQNLQYSGPAGACPAGGAASPCIAPIWDAGPNNWDIGVADGSNVGKDINPINSLVQSNYGWSGGSGNRVGGPDPLFVQSYLPGVQVDPYRLQPRFRPSQLVTVNFPANVLGDYSIPAGSGAVGIDPTGSTTLGWGTVVSSPAVDIALNPRPSGVPAAWDAGAFQPPAAPVVPIVIPGGGGGGPGGGGGGGAGAGAGGAGAGGGGAGGAGAGGGGGAGKVGGPAGGAGTKGAAGPATPTAILDVSNNHTHVVTGSTTHGSTRPTGGSSASGSSGLGFGGVGAGGPRVTTAQPPAGSSIGVDAVGGPDSAGNTPEVQLPGTAGSATGSAGMPGGVAGGGHFTYPNHIRHKPARKGGFGSLTNPLLWIPAGLILALLAILYGRRRRPSHRRRRGGPSGQPPASSPPPDDDPASGRQLELAGKGELS
jgi:hypothetical protein